MIKRFLILFCLLGVIDLFCPVNLYAGNPRVVAVRIVGSNPNPGVGGIVWKAWLNNDVTGAINIVAQPIISHPALTGSYDWEYLLMFNLANFPTWLATDMLNIEVTVNGKTSSPWVEKIGTQMNVSSGYQLDPSKFITFAATPPALAIAGSVCAGGNSTNITVSNVTDYSKYTIKVVDAGGADKTSLFTVGSLGATTTIAAKTGTAAGGYTVHLMEGANSKATAALTVGIAASVSIAATAGQKDGNDAYYCDGGSDKKSVTLTPSGSSNYSWKLDGTAIAGSSAITPSVPGSYTVTANPAGGCPGTATITVKELTAPAVPVITPPGDPHVCKNDGGSTVLAVNSPVSGYTYTWTGTSASSSGVVNHSAVASTTTGSSVTVKTSDGKCASNPSTKVTLYGHEISVSLSPSGVQSVASGSKPTVTATATCTPNTGSVDVTTWSWSGSIASTTTPTANTSKIETNPITANNTKYSVNVKDNRGCPSNKPDPTVTFNIIAGSAWDIKADDVKGCQGTTINIAAVPTPGGTPVAPVTYTWTTNDPITFANANSASTTVSGTTPGVYHATVTVTDKNNVVKTAIAEVKIYGLPTLTSVEVLTPASVCKDKTVDLRANGGLASTTVLDQSANINYMWSANAIAGAGNLATSKALVAGANKFDVYVQDGNGCKSATKSVTHNAHEVKVTAKIDNSTTTKQVNYGASAPLDCQVTFNPVGSSTVATYAWSGGAGINGVANTQTATTNSLTAPGTYTVKVTDVDGCEGTDDISYTINGGPLQVQVPDVYICAGAVDVTPVPTVSGGSNGVKSYKWIAKTAGLTFADDTQEKPVVTTTTPGVYKATVKVTEGAQTIESAEVEITIGAQPELLSSAIYQNGVMIPNNGTAVLPNSVVEMVVNAGSLPAGTVYTWEPAGLIAATSADELEITSVPLTIGNKCFKLTVKNADGKCPDMEEACVPVSGKAFTVNMPDVTVCNGTALQIPAGSKIDGGVKPYTDYIWTCANALFKHTLSADKATMTVDPTTPAGTYTVNLEVVDSKGNRVNDDFDVTINPVPSFIQAPASPITTKVGQTVALSATATPANATIQWQGSPMGIQTGTTGTASVVAGPFAGVGEFPYTVSAAIGTTCVKDSVIIVKVADKVADIVITAADVDACEKEDKLISADAIGGSGSLSFRWEIISGDIQLTSMSGKVTSIKSASVGTHRVKVIVTDNDINDPAPQQEKIITVTVYGKPTINSLLVDNVTSGVNDINPLVVDYGDELRLNATATPFNSTLQWTETGSTLLSPNGSPVYTKPVTGTSNTYTVTATANGCSASQNVTVTVKKPEGGALLELELERQCADSGKDMILSMKASGGTSYSFTLKNTNGLSQSFTGAGPWTYSISQSGQDTYFVQDFKAFKNGIEITPTSVSPKEGIEALFYVSPAITIANGNIQTACEGSAVTLNASSQLSGTTYTWDKDIQNGQPFFPKGSDVYTVTAVSEKGCKATSTVNVTMVSRPSVTVNAQPETICLGESVTLTADGSAAEYTWNNGQTGKTITVKPNVGGTIKYVVTGKELLNGCSDTAVARILVNEPPVIVSTSKTVRSIAIGKGATFAVKATGKNLTYEWQRWTGDEWLTLYDAPTEEPSVSGATTDSLRLAGVPKSWDNTKLKCVVTNSCGQADTTFLLQVKECFDILDVQWEMCEGIRPETDPTVEVDGWYCPGTRIAICARLVLEDEDADVENAVYRWTVDGLSTEDGRWGEMEFITKGNVLSWIPPVQWQDNITVALCAYIDGACDTVCKSYLRLKAMKYADLDWKLHTSVDPSRRFCPGDEVTYWIEDLKQTAGKKPTYRWYNDIFDLHTDTCPYNEVIKLEQEKLIMKMGQQNTWVKVVMTPSPEICTREPYYVDTAFLAVKPMVHPEFSIWTEDTLVCRNDEVYLEAKWKNAGENPSFQWVRSIGYPYWNLGNKYFATTTLTEDDIWIKCTLTPSPEVCYDKDTIFVDAIQIKGIQDPEIRIFADMENKRQGDEIIVESDIDKMPVQNPIYKWYINSLISPETEDVLISSEFNQGDKIQLGMRGEKFCQNQVLSNVLIIDFEATGRDTMILIYQGETIRNLDVFKLGDEHSEFTIAANGYTGVGKASMGLDGKFNYVPDPNFTGKEKVTYTVYNPRTGRTETGHIYIQVMDKSRFFVPNIITPNGDGANDYWDLSGFIDQYPSHLVTVFNRSGHIVFQTRNYDNKWNGQGDSRSGNMWTTRLPSGIYSYVIYLGDGLPVLTSWLEIRVDPYKARSR